MCTINQGLKFCTCEDLSGAEYTWRLTRYLGNDSNGPVGSIVAPSHDLGAGLTSERILACLNGGAAFDFDYLPLEKDSIRFHRKTRDGYWYMSFLFENGMWVEGMNPYFTSIDEEIAKGKVEYE
jgi:hypothetical protein